MTTSTEIRISSQAANSLLDLCTELGAHLRRRRDELIDEVRNYPTPIARCDVQLGGLIEQRTHAIRSFELLDATQHALARGDHDMCVAYLEEIAAVQAFGVDPVETAIARLRSVLAAAREDSTRKNK